MPAVNYVLLHDDVLCLSWTAFENMVAADMLTRTLFPFDYFDSNLWGRFRVIVRVTAQSIHLI